MRNWCSRAGGWVVVAIAPLSLALLSHVASGEETKNLVKNGDAEAGTIDNWADGNNSTSVVSAGAHSGKSCFSSRKGTTVLSTELMPIDPSKTYVLSGWFKSPGKVKSKLYFGHVPYDADKRQIQSYEIVPLDNTETTLAQACSPNDGAIKVADGADWQAGAYVAFDVDDSGRYKDLPNRKVSSPILKVEKKGAAWEAQFRDKCGQTFPAGTKVRLHVSSGSYVYNAATNAEVPAEWTQYTATIKGLALSGHPSTQWGPGTKFIQIVILPNYDQGDTSELLFDDISLTVSEK